MKYGHLVKHNGILYKAGEEVPVEDFQKTPAESGKSEDGKKPEPTKGFLDVDDLKTYEPDALKELATKLGVEFTEETTHEELAELCSKVEVDIPQTEDSKVEYKKSDIQRMNVEALKELATKLEIEGAQDKTGAVLKEEIIAKLSL